MTQTTGSLNLSDLDTLSRYRHLLRTADPDELVWAHEDAFDQLTAMGRRTVRERLADELAPYDAARLGEEPGELARVAVRRELRRPGTLERVVGTALDRVAAVVTRAVAIDLPRGTWMAD